MALVPRRQVPYEDAATAWNRACLLGCERSNEDIRDAIRTFRDQHRLQGPEPLRLVHFPQGGALCLPSKCASHKSPSRTVRRSTTAAWAARHVRC